MNTLAQLWTFHSQQWICNCFANYFTDIWLLSLSLVQLLEKPFWIRCTFGWPKRSHRSWQQNQNIWRTYFSQIRIQHKFFAGCAVAGCWKSKTQRGNFSTTYPTLLTPVKKIYFKMEFFATFRKRKKVQAPSRWVAVHAKFRIMFDIEGFSQGIVQFLHKCDWLEEDWQMCMQVLAQTAVCTHLSIMRKMRLPSEIC